MDQQLDLSRELTLRLPREQRGGSTRLRKPLIRAANRPVRGLVSGPVNRLVNPSSRGACVAW